MNFDSTSLPYRSDAACYYAALADLPWPAWLDSGGMSRFDILTAAPHRTLVQDELTASADPFDLVRKELGKAVNSIANVPFAGGALGYWSYDLARNMMSLPSIARASDKVPLMAVGIYDWALVIDHLQRSAKLVSHRRFTGTKELLPEIIARLKDPPPLGPDTFKVHGKVHSNFTQESYTSAFNAVQGYLLAGDCYQVNLAQSFSAKAEGDALGAYLRLRASSPAPYAAYLDFPEARILCNSPERFIYVQNGMVESRPIKGTRPRNRDPKQDRQLAEDLGSNPKDRAENLMIVDLMRSDLGKSCEPGSVHVPRLFEVESFANVHHLVSTIQGRIAAGRDALDVLRDCFPGGSVTGAPKLRAMQIIEQLEPDRRGVYCGAIGYVGFDGNMDTNIAIRTLAQTGTEIRCWAGGGIVADSEVMAEYQETLDKATVMLGLLRHYGGA